MLPTHSHSFSARQPLHSVWLVINVISGSFLAKASNQVNGKLNEGGSSTDLSLFY